ncbi:MAG: DUF92 domain-containing protein [Methanophagales archaeon]|nr:DUF92 domain-containing protein [Methanophagales archaeon]MCW3141063.1 DUF92 domain-containing protein [Methanophagales archaeon]
MLFIEPLHQHPLEIATALTVLVAFSFVLYAYLKRKINTSAFTGTLTLGMIILLTFGFKFGYAGVLMLLTFFLFGNLVTKYKYDKKAKLGVAEGNRGMRDINNVLGNGLSPLFFAVLFACQNHSTIFLLGFSGAVATACADTFSTEIGQAEGNPRLITTLKKVPVGTNGGVSLPGLCAALLGSCLISLVGLAFWFDLQMTSRTIFSLSCVCLLSGFLGCIMDSFLGATIEDKPFYKNRLRASEFRLNKHHVNILATLFGGIFAILLGYYLGLQTQ